jgi:hypothetical protein
MTDLSPGLLPATLSRIAVELVGECERHAIPLRVVGGLGVWLHCPRIMKMGIPRHYQRDIDFVAPLNADSRMESVLMSSGFRTTEKHNTKAGRHYVFVHDLHGLSIDVYFGALHFNHAIAGSHITMSCKLVVPITSLLLSKMAIVGMTSKDKIDLIAMLFDHPIDGQSTCESIQPRNLLAVWAQGCRGWGLTKTCRDNLELLRLFVSHQPGLVEECRTTVLSRIEEMDALMKHIPKSRRWRVRGAIGTRIPWYDEVRPTESVFDGVDPRRKLSA